MDASFDFLIRVMTPTLLKTHFTQKVILLQNDSRFLFLQEKACFVTRVVTLTRPFTRLKRPEATSLNIIGSGDGV